MIIVTGAFGFIGAKLVKHLNRAGIRNIGVCDYLTNGKQFKNLNNTSYSCFISPNDLENVIKTNFIDPVEKIYHLGAITNTTYWNGELMLERNTKFTINLIDLCHNLRIPISYASSASVYGNGDGPLNLYAYSKWLIDQHVLKKQSAYVQGFRYFNVWSDDNSEWHKEGQASPFYTFKKQAQETGEIKIFEGSELFYRDFIHVNDVCRTQLSFNKPGIYDLGSGKQISFLDVAKRVQESYQDSIITTIPFPEHLRDYYQTGTLANMEYLNKG